MKIESTLSAGGIGQEKMPVKKKDLAKELKKMNAGNETAADIITNMEDPHEIIQEIKNKAQNKAKLEIASIGLSEEKKNEYYQLIQDVIDSKSTSTQNEESYDDYVSGQIKWMSENDKGVGDFVRSVEDKLTKDIEAAIAKKMAQEMPTN